MSAAWLATAALLVNDFWLACEYAAIFLELLAVRWHAEHPHMTGVQRRKLSARSAKSDRSRLRLYVPRRRLRSSRRRFAPAYIAVKQV